MARRTFTAIFGAVVRRHREQRGLSQERLAELADLHRNHVGLIERAERSPSIEIAHRIAAGLGITLSGLVAEVERELSTGVGSERRRRNR
jgi:XRE family transcriptional regulator, regulator of sulfur utilization